MYWRFRWKKWETRFFNSVLFLVKDGDNDDDSDNDDDGDDDDGDNDDDDDGDDDDDDVPSPQHPFSVILDALFLWILIQSKST